MSKKIIGVTVGTPISPSKLQQKLNPVKTVNGKSPDENGNVEIIAGLRVTAESDTATLGDELVTDEGWALGTGWSGSLASGFTHASEYTEPLTFTPPAITAGSLYQVTFKSSVEMTTDNLFVQVGNSTQFNLYFDKMDDSSISIGVLTADTNGLVFTPSSDFAGTLTQISLREIMGTYEAVQQYFDTNGAVSLEIHVTPRGLENVFIGNSVGEMNTSGRANVGIGTDSLTRNTSGFWNTAIGTQCLKNNTGGSRNIAIGRESLRDNEVGQRNIAIGTYTLSQIKNGNWNIAIGADSMHKATGGEKNIAVGFNTLTKNGASENVAIGANVLQNNTTGKQLTAIGYNAMSSNTSGSNNVAVGRGALQKNTTGEYNTAVGDTALYNLTTGQKNVAIGMGAAKSLTTGKGCVAIGAGADLEATTSYQLNIGNLLKGSLASGAAYLLLDGGLRLPSIPTTHSGEATEVWNNGGVLMVGDGGLDTIVQAVIAALGGNIPTQYTNIFTHESTELKFNVTYAGAERNGAVCVIVDLAALGITTSGPLEVRFRGLVVDNTYQNIMWSSDKTSWTALKSMANAGKDSNGDFLVTISTLNPATKPYLLLAFRNTTSAATADTYAGSILTINEPIGNG
jgi:hypothetical protein